MIAISLPRCVPAALPIAAGAPAAEGIDWGQHQHSPKADAPEHYGICV